MDELSSKVKGDGMDVFEKLLEDFCQEWPDLLPLFLGNYESAYGTGIRARLRAVMWWLHDRPSESTTRARIVALLLFVLQLIQDDPPGIGLLGPRLIPAGAGVFRRPLSDFCEGWPRFSRIPGIGDRLTAAIALLDLIRNRHSKSASGRRVIDGLLRVLRTIQLDPEGSHFLGPCDGANKGEEDADPEGVAPLACQADAQPNAK